MDESSGMSGESVGSLRQLVELLMLSPPADPVAHGDALTAHQVSGMLGIERSEVVGVWRTVAAEHAAHARAADWLDRLREALRHLEGLGTLREVAAVSASVGGEDSDSHRAYALTRATVESSGRLGVAWRRSGVTVLVSSKDDGRGAPMDPHELMGHASELRHIVSGLVASGDVVSVGRLEQAVRISQELSALAMLSGGRMSELAAAQLPHVLSNRRRELYLADLKPVHALAAVADTLPTREVTVEELQRRVRGRFPDARPLPDRPALDEAVLVATGRRWGRSGYGPSR